MTDLTPEELDALRALAERDASGVSSWTEHWRLILGLLDERDALEGRLKHWQKEAFDTAAKVAKAKKWLVDRNALRIERDLLKGGNIALISALAEAREDVCLAAGELLVDMEDAPPGSLVSRLLIANRLMSRERDALKVEVEKLEAEALAACCACCWDRTAISGKTRCGCGAHD